MNILFVTNFFPMFGNGNSGASNRSTMFVSALASIGHVDVISFAGEEISTIPDVDVVFSQHVQNNRQVPESRIKNVIKLLKPFSPSYHYPIDNGKQDIINEFLSRKEYDYIACRYFHEAVYCGLLRYPTRLILDLDDTPQSVIRKDALHCKTLRNRIWHIAYSRTLCLMTRFVLKDVFCSFYSNANQPPSPKSHYLHNVALLKQDVGEVSPSLPKRILIVGWMDYLPNKVGVNHFLENVYPDVIAMDPSVELHIVGKLSDENMKQKWNTFPNVHCLGYVADLAEEYAQARMVVIPLYEGSGTSVKLVEAMQMKRPCVSTKVGMRGFEDILIPGRDLVVTESDSDFSRKIVELMDDVERGNNLARNAARVVDMHLSKEKFTSIVVDSIKASC